MPPDEPRRIYHDLHPRKGYPIGSAFRYECGRCGDVIHSRLGNERMRQCACKNITFEDATIVVREHSQVRLFSVADS